MWRIIQTEASLPAFALGPRIFSKLPIYPSVKPSNLFVFSGLERSGGESSNCWAWYKRVIDFACAQRSESGAVGVGVGVGLGKEEERKVRMVWSSSRAWMDLYSSLGQGVVISSSLYAIK